MTSNLPRVSRRRMLRSVGLGIAGTTLAGCTDSVGGGSSSNEVKVGLLLPTSGAYGYLGTAFRKSYKYVVKNINKSDEKLPDKKFKIMDGDTKSESQTGLKEARRLVTQENVDILVGAVSSETAGTVSKFASANDTPYQIGLATSYTLTTGADCQYSTVRAIATTKILPQVAGAFGVNNIGNNAYLVYPDYTTGYQHRKLFPKNVKKAGGTMAGQTAAPLGNNQWGTIINKIESADPDFVFLGNPGDGVLPFFTQAANRGLDVPVIANSMTSKLIASLGKENIKKLGTIYRYTRYTREIDNKANNKFVSGFKKKFGKPPIYPHGYGAINANMTALALEKSDSVKFDSLMKSYEGLNWKAIVGDVKIRGCDHQGVPAVYMSKVKGVNSKQELGTSEIIQSYDSSEYITPCSNVACSFNN